MTEFDINPTYFFSQEAYMALKAFLKSAGDELPHEDEQVELVERIMGLIDHATRLGYSIDDLVNLSGPPGTRN